MCCFNKNLTDGLLEASNTRDMALSVYSFVRWLMLHVISYIAMAPTLFRDSECGSAVVFRAFIKSHRY